MMHTVQYLLKCNRDNKACGCRNLQQADVGQVFNIVASKVLWKQSEGLTLFIRERRNSKCVNPFLAEDSNFTIGRMVFSATEK